MTLTSIRDVPEGATISFRSKNPNNLVDWKGVLESKGTYKSIQRLLDPRSENEAVRQSDPSVLSDVTKLLYFQITVDNNAGQPTLMVFADEWIQPGSLIKTVLGNRVTVEIEDPENNSQAILSLLASQGYPCTIIPNR